ncbi:SRPBCC family protein [Kineosporia sp. A_224]|uniref:SRPBCC family protein n=1 Tax=Kineosporia sp. A_224 TaxID=1962180 RepID=UPI000B4B095B|nr:SRPBCC family protein [Kineosporia sp. A_224]
MGDYERSTTVDAPVDEIFEFLSKVENLPRYMDRMTEAHPVTGDEVSVEARLDPRDVGDDVGDGAPDGTRTVRGQAWFRIDADHRRLAWGADGPHDYSGELEVAAADTDPARSTVTVRLRTTHESPGIEDGLEETLENIRRITGTPPGA